MGNIGRPRYARRASMARSNHSQFFLSHMDFITRGRHYDTSATSRCPFFLILLCVLY